VNDYVEVAPSSDFTYGGNLTVETWMRWDGTSSVSYQIPINHGWSGGCAYRLHIHPSGALEFSACTGSSSMGGALSAGAWQHVAIINNGSWQVYVDGTLALSHSGAAPTDMSEQVLEFGSVGDSSCGSCPTDYAFNGAFDSARISNTARYTSTFEPPSTLITDEYTIGLWQFDEGSGTSTEDASGNGHTATLHGPSWSGDCGAESEVPGEGLTCAIDTESTDADGDTVDYTFSWDVDGTAYSDTETTTYDGDAVSADSLGYDETWTCTVTPNDGEEDGDSASAAYVTESEPCYGHESSCPALSCNDILESGLSDGDGNYWIDPDDSGAMQLHCDMTSNGGGWTLIAQGGSLTCSGMIVSSDLSSDDSCSYLDTLDVQRLATDAAEVMLSVGDNTAELGDWSSCWGGSPCTVYSLDVLAITALRSSTETWHNGASWSGWDWTMPGTPHTLVGWPDMYQTPGNGDGVHWKAHAYHHSNNGSGTSTNLISATYVR
jgi:hypothetical protein